MNNSAPLPPVGGTSCVADLGRFTEQVIRILGRTKYGDCRSPYRNGKTGNLSFPMLSPLEIEAKRKNEELSDG
ncbi:MAG TPA: hypothetical protein VF389_11840 [Woeseiaceae bacterium]